MSSEVILKKCPFCGGEAYISETLNRMYIDAHHLKNCSITPNTWLSSCKTLDDHIKVWNQRV